MAKKSSFMDFLAKTGGFFADVCRGFGSSVGAAGKRVGSGTGNAAAAIGNTIKNINLGSVKERFILNFNIFLRSRSMYLVLLFLPVILTLIIGLSTHSAFDSDGKIGYYSADGLTDNVVLFLKKFDGYKLTEYSSSFSCRDATGTGKEYACLLVHGNFLINDAQPDAVSLFADNSDEEKYNDLLTSVNASLVSAINVKQVSDKVLIKTENIKSQAEGSIILGIITFFIMFVSVIFASVTTFHRRADASEYSAQPNKYSELVYDILLTTFISAFILSLALLWGFSFYSGAPFLGVLHKILLILIFSLPLFAMIGILIGFLAMTEEMNLFASISTMSIFVFLSDVILPYGWQKSLLYYIFHVNPYYLSSTLFTKMMLLSSKLSENITYILTLLIIALLFVTVFIVLNYVLLTDYSKLLNIIKVKKRDYYGHDYVDINKLRNYQQLNTEELSKEDYALMTLLSQRSKNVARGVRPQYKSIVNVKLNKDEKRNLRNFEEKKIEKLEEHMKMAAQKRQEERQEKKYCTPSHTNAKQQEDNVFHEKQHSQHYVGDVACHPSHPTNGDASKGNDSKRDEEDLIMSIELENEILELKNKSMRDEEIVEKLKGKFDINDIKRIIRNFS